MHTSMCFGVFVIAAESDSEHRPRGTAGKPGGPVGEPGNHFAGKLSESLHLLASTQPH